MVATFEQVFLKPGIIDGVQVTPADIRAYVDGTQRMIGEGYRPPILFEHAAPGSDEGAPRDIKAREVKNGAGWVTGVNVGADGSASYTLEVTDSEAARKLREGSIRFTSPELRPRGFRKWNTPLIAHAALTHLPRFTGQGPIQPRSPVQLSLCDKPLQLSLDKWTDAMDDEDKKPDDEIPVVPEVPAEPPENPDMPEVTADADPQFQALTAQLKEVLGIDLPSDASPDSLVRDMLLAIKTYAAVKAAMKAESTTEPEPDTDVEPVEDRAPPMQFSLADATSGKAPGLLAKCIKAAHQSLSTRLDRLVSNEHITPALRDTLAAKTALQFSADAEEVPALTLGQVVGWLEEHTLPGMAWGNTEQLSLPDDLAAVPGNAGSVTPEQAKKIVDAQSKHVRGLAVAN